MKFIAGETATITLSGSVLLIKVEDASKGDTISARVENILSGGSDYQIGRIYEFKRDDIEP